jgi:hypothetical protein
MLGPDTTTLQILLLDLTFLARHRTDGKFATTETLSHTTQCQLGRPEQIQGAYVVILPVLFEY